MQMERWDGNSWGLNATYAEHDPNCWLLRGVHYLTWTDTKSYGPTYDKGKVSVLKTSRADDFPGLSTMKSGKIRTLTPLPPTEKTIFFHIMRAHLQAILATSADKQPPPELDITHFVWVGDRKWHPSTGHI